MKAYSQAKRVGQRLGFIFLILATASSKVLSAKSAEEPKEPAVLVLYDGANQESNPGRLDAFYLGNLLGHFTTHRTVVPIDTYAPGEMDKYDATFIVIYQKAYRVPDLLLKDAAASPHPLCWLGNQVGQLDRFGGLKSRGLRFDRFFQDAPLTGVTYKGQTVGKGDPDTNLMTVLDSSLAQTIAVAVGTTTLTAPYIVRSGAFWAVADSPFSYSDEHDRLLVFADVLHDILNVQHAEKHRALIRIEDVNPMSDPEQIRDVASLMKKERVPYSIGVVPVYVNGRDRTYIRMSERTRMVSALTSAAESGATFVLHGYTHQYRGVTTDDYEFWDDLTDRPVRGDSESYAARRVDQAMRELATIGVFPITWETPHYAGSAADYRAFSKIFNTTYERRQTANHLGSDEFFPYPVIDMYGQRVIPENLGYIPLSNPSAKQLIANAKAALVVRDGYASGFLHPFLAMSIIEDFVTSVKGMGFEFQDLRDFPNHVEAGAVVVSNLSGSSEIAGEGSFLHTRIQAVDGSWGRQVTKTVASEGRVKIDARVKPGETFVAFRNHQRDPTVWERIWRMAKGDVASVQRRIESFMSPPSAEEMHPAFMLWNPKAKGAESVDQDSFLALLTHLGVDVQKQNVEDFTLPDLHAESVLVVPAASAKVLSDEMAASLIPLINNGLVLITDGESALSKGLGLTLRQDVPIVGLYDHTFPSQIVRWTESPRVPVIEAVPDGAQLYYSDADQRNALVIGEERGQGRYLYFAPLFDPVSGVGYGRFPSIPFLLLNELQIRPWLRRPASEAYFDPGFRQNVSVERLAQLWKRSGIRVVHAAAWHFYDKYSYDYARLIRVAHQNGIMVYAWYEWPHVSQQFWNKHPEWRQKNAFGADAKVDWRYLMNFSDPACFKTVIKDAEDVLGKYDWDGVNLAEFHFECVTPDIKARFTPFDPVNRAAFKKLHGFDPIELVDERSPHFWKTDPASLRDFWDYRRTTNSKLLDALLIELKRINKSASPARETVLTVIDTLVHPEYRDLLAIDLDATVAAVNKSDVTFQIEDPGVDWSKPPTRYNELADRYSKFPFKRPIMVDINVLPVHPDSQAGFPTAQPTGAEIIELWRAAASRGSRVVLYSEWTLSENDWDLLPYAMAHDATIKHEDNGWTITSSKTVQFEVGPNAHRWMLDGRLWPCHNKTLVWIPPGQHRLEPARRQDDLIDTSELATRLVDISGELLGADSVSTAIDVEYNSDERCLLTFNKRPYKLMLDGVPAKLSTVQLGEEFTVVAPPGEHRIRVNSGHSLYFFVQFFSAVSGSLIVLFGILSSGLLGILFIAIRIRRRWRLIQTRLRRHSHADHPKDPVS